MYVGITAHSRGFVQGPLFPTPTLGLMVRTLRMAHFCRGPPQKKPRSICLKSSIRNMQPCLLLSGNRTKRSVYKQKKEAKKALEYPESRGRWGCREKLRGATVRSDWWAKF